MQHPTRIGLLVLAALAWSVGRSAAEEFRPLPNPEFTEGDAQPAGWTLSGGQGRWVDRQILEVSGRGDDSNYWRCDYRFTPGALYHFQMRGRRVGGNGSTISGPAAVNRDYQFSDQWQWYDYVFRVPDGVEDSYFRLGQWEATGAIQFDAVRLSPAMPVHTGLMTPFGLVTLGQGEAIRDGRYTFSGTFDGQGSNYHRTLHRCTADFNSNRWFFRDEQEVVYRFELPGNAFQEAEIACNVNYHAAGGCQLDVSRDDAAWQTLATRRELGTIAARVPAELLPAGTLFVRLRSLPERCSFQINQVDFSARLAESSVERVGFSGPAMQATPNCVGQTVFADVQDNAGATAQIEQITMAGLTGGMPTFHVTARNTGTTTADVQLTGSYDCDVRAGGRPLSIAGGESRTVRITFPAGRPDEHTITFTAQTGNAPAAQATMQFSVPDYYRIDYGARIDGIDGATAVWWCDATHKIARQRIAPLTPTAAATFSAARNDREGVQIVLRPTQDLRGLTAVAGSLTGPDGATIGAEEIKILRVAYHFVHHATDPTGVVDDWPDALPPLAKPIDLPAGKNQPLWVLVHVPADAKPGDYAGTISLRADGFSADVPLKLHVWNFALPERNHVETAFGLSPENVFRYHQLKTDADRRRVLDMYFESFAEHRISPYDPAPLDPIRVRFRPETDPPSAEVDFSAFDPAMARAVERFHFTAMQLPVQGMGGGTFHQRVDPQIGRFGADAPEYQAMFGSYVKQLESHLREKDWLKLSYVYWFDEPDPKDYQFVADGMQRLKKYAPGLRRMLTEEPGDNPLAGTVDIWCPVSFNYNHEAAQRRRAQGERFWWYVCCGPKAPYCTLFIDHPATELRTWLWQTWQRDIVGVLVWSTNYWSSDAAYPDSWQNPYADPMGYVSGYSTPRGTKVYWGNGDGRFVYPPEAAAVPGLSGDGPVIEPPVSSIRWEMLREGIEDYEYLYMLRDLIAQRRPGLSSEQIRWYEGLIEVPEAITRDMTTFTTDPAPIYARRAEIAAAIEELVQPAK